MRIVIKRFIQIGLTQWSKTQNGQFTFDRRITLKLNGKRHSDPYIDLNK